MEILNANSPQITHLLQTLDQIENRMSDLVLKRAERHWLSPAQATKELDISKRTLARYRDKMGLPHARIGDKVFYKRSDLELFLHSHMVD